MAHILPFEQEIAELDDKIEKLETLKDRFDILGEIKLVKDKRNQLFSDLVDNLTLKEKIQIARHPDRPHTGFYIKKLITDFVELSGDRLFREDKAIIAGIGKFKGKPTAVIGHQKGATTKENLKYNFGMANPEGYRKTQRVMSIAEKFHLPIINFIDTPGAYPGAGAEERGQAEAIAVNLYKLSILKTPIISIITGEGGSGGALSLAVADYVAMLSYSIYGVISPEGCSSILWKSPDHADQAANAMKITPGNLLQLGIIDDIIKEPIGGAHRDKDEMARRIGNFVETTLNELQSKDIKKIVKQRYDKLRKMGNSLL